MKVILFSTYITCLLWWSAVIMALRHYWEPCTVGGHSLPKFLNDDQCSRMAHCGLKQFLKENSLLKCKKGWGSAEGRANRARDGKRMQGLQWEEPLTAEISKWWPLFTDGPQCTGLKSFVKVKISQRQYFLLQFRQKSNKIVSALASKMLE